MCFQEFCKKIGNTCESDLIVQQLVRIENISFGNRELSPSECAVPAMILSGLYLVISIDQAFTTASLVRCNRIQERFWVFGVNPSELIAPRSSSYLLYAIFCHMPLYAAPFVSTELTDSVESFILVILLLLLQVIQASIPGPMIIFSRQGYGEIYVSRLTFICALSSGKCEAKSSLWRKSDAYSV